MKYLTRPVFLLLAVVFFNLSVSAQIPKNMPSLPDTATLEETQAWLIRAITQNSSFTAAEGTTQDMLGTKKSKNMVDSKVSELKFKGCQMSYEVDRTTQVQKNDRMSTSPFPQVASERTLKVTLNLKDLDPAEITVQQTDDDSKYNVISMRTANYKRVIKLKDEETGDATVSTATLVVGINVGEQTKEALAHAVTLCQAL